MSEGPGFADWVGLVRRRYRFLILVPLAAGLFCLGLSFVLPRTYEATLRVLPPHESNLLMDFGGLLSALRLSSEIPYSSGVTLLDVYIAILGSDTVARSLIERFDLKDVYSTSTMDHTLRRLRRNTRIQPTLQGLIQVRVGDRDPERAAALANAYAEELERVYRETQFGAARRQREFLERRLTRSLEELEALELRMSRNQVEAGLTAMSRDASEAALASGELLGRRLAVSVRLDMLEKLGAEDIPLRRELEVELASLEREIALLPGLGIQLARDLRDLRIQETLFHALNQQLETARIEEARDTPVIEILDPARVPDRHARPRKSLVTAAGLVLGLGLALFVTVLQESPRLAAVSSER